MVTYPVDARHRHTVFSTKMKTTGKCGKSSTFKTFKDVYAKGRFFPPNSNVDIYVTLDRNWQRGDNLIGTDVSGGVETVPVNHTGRFRCTQVWGNPLTIGRYDIVVDANQDGTYDPRDGDGVDTRRGVGFWVK